MNVDENGSIEGYASTWGGPDSHGDSIDRGAYSDTLAQAKRTGKMPRMFLSHAEGPLATDALPIGRWDSAHEDDRGLFVKGRLAVGNSRADDALALMRMSPPILNGLSIGFIARKFTLLPKGNAIRRRLHAIDLKEVSIVHEPSCDSARITSVKSTIRNREAEFRAVGYSRSEAKRLARVVVEEELSDSLTTLRDTIRAACR
jgi:HK97 family phage prohead protease